MLNEPLCVRRNEAELVDGDLHRVHQLDPNQDQQELPEQLEQLPNLQQEQRRSQHVPGQDPSQLDCGEQHHACHHDEQDAGYGGLKFVENRQQWSTVSLRALAPQG